MDDRKEFLLYWGEGYESATPMLVNGMHRFSDDFGYDNDHRESIATLEVKQCLDLSDMSGKHFILRVK